MHWCIAAAQLRCPVASATCPAPQRVIELGKLTPKVLEVFQRTGHEALLERVAAMGIKSWIAPVLPIGTGGPLGFSRKPWS